MGIWSIISIAIHVKIEWFVLLSTNIGFFVNFRWIWSYILLILPIPWVDLEHLLALNTLLWGWRSLFKLFLLLSSSHRSKIQLIAEYFHIQFNLPFLLLSNWLGHWRLNFFLSFWLRIELNKVISCRFYFEFRLSNFHSWFIAHHFSRMNFLCWDFLLLKLVYWLLNRLILC